MSAFLLATACFGEEEWKMHYVPAEDGLPTEAGLPWVVGAMSAGHSATIEDEALRIDTMKEASSLIRFEQFNGWDSTQPGEIELVVRVVDEQTSGNPSGHFLISGPHGWQTITLGVDKVTLGGSSLRINLSDYQTLRIRVSGSELDPDAITLTIGDYSPPLMATWNAPTSGESASSTESKIAFGDLSTTDGFGGIVDWKSIRWKSGE